MILFYKFTDSSCFWNFFPLPWWSSTLFFRTTHASVALGSLSRNISTTTPVSPSHLCRWWEKPRLCISLLWFLSHWTVIFGGLFSLHPTESSWLQTHALLIVVSSAFRIWQIFNKYHLDERMNKCMKHFLYFPTSPKNKTHLVDEILGRTS